MLQNLPSVAAALALSPTPGSRAIDMCAAPGGKSTLLAQLMGDRGELVAVDRSHSKVWVGGGAAAVPAGFGGPLWRLRFSWCLLDQGWGIHSTALHVRLHGETLVLNLNRILFSMNQRSGGRHQGPGSRVGLQLHHRHQDGLDAIRAAPQAEP